MTALISAMFSPAATGSARVAIVVGADVVVADVLVRRPAPSLPQTRADDRPPKLEPVLEDQVFEHVLAVIRKQGLHIEQNVRTYLAMGEEDRRNVILSALTTHYDVRL